MGRPKKEIDAKQVERMAKVGCTVEEMSCIIGCDKRTLERRFAALIEKGRADLKQSLKHKQVQLALDGDRTMLIWLGKQYLGQSDKAEQQVDQTVTVKDESSYGQSDSATEAAPRPVEGDAKPLTLQRA